jgi:hypothetical protein
MIRCSHVLEHGFQSRLPLGIISDNGNWRHRKSQSGKDQRRTSTGLEEMVSTPAPWIIISFSHKAGTHGFALAKPGYP